MSKDLRGYLESLRKQRPSDIIDIDREVSPRYETAAILSKLEDKRRSPVLVFHRVAGSPFPLVTNLCGSTGRLALALGCRVPDLFKRYGEGCASPITPSLVTGAPAQQHVLRGRDIDLRRLPQLVYHENDADLPYITAAIVVARNPDSGVSNLSYHRLMVCGPSKTGIFMERGKHLDQIFRRYVQTKEAMPVAVFIGAHPVWSLGALYSGPADVDEYDIIGGLLGQPLEVAPCLLEPDLRVPAHAEFVLEGRVPHDERIDEGPFGEFTGYGTGRTKTPVLHVETLTHRRNPIFQDIVSGRMEHLILPLPAIQRRMFSEARRAAPNVTAVSLVAPLTTTVALKKTHDDEPAQLIEALLSGDIYSKHVVVVDADIDVHDLRQVMTAVALHVQADRDVHILKDAAGTPLDPSVFSEDGRTSKMGIDATRPLRSTRPVTRNRIPQHVLDAVDLSSLGKRR